MHNLDLRFSGSLTTDLSKLLTKIAKNNVFLFNKLMGKAYYQINKENFEDFVCNPASSRTPFSSRVFFYFCCFLLVKSNIKKNFLYSKIYVDSYELMKILKKLLINYNVKIIYKPNSSSFSFLKSYIYFILRLILIKSTLIIFKRKKKIKKISTVIISNVIKNHIEKNRYFPNICNQLKKKIAYIPNILIYNFFELYSSCKKLRNSKQIFIIKEDYISLKDLIYFFNYKKRIKKIYLKENKFLEFDFSKILYEDLVNPIGNFSIFESMLNIKFISKIKDEIKINTFLGWFENQNIDRSISYSINKYYPLSYNYGYKGMITSDLYLSQNHTIPEDRLFNIIPRKIYVVGKGFIKETKKFDKKLDVSVGSALRFSHLWKKQKKVLKENVLIALPIQYEESIFIIKLIQKILLDGYLLNFNFYFLPHPTHNINKFNLIFQKNEFKNMSIKKGYFSDLIQNCSTLISGMSSTCMEAIALGKKTVIIEFLDKFFFSCIPKNINKDLFLISSNKKEIVDYLIKNIKKSGKNKQIKKLYFSKPSLYSNKHMLNL